MQISSMLNTANIAELSAQKEDTSASEEYLKVVKKLYPEVAYQTRDEINSADDALAKFKEDLKTKGASELLKDLNEEKINAIVENYKQKLQEEQKENPDKPMDIDKMVSDFKQKLLKELMEAQKAEQELKDNMKQASISTSDMLTKIKMSQETEKKGDNVMNFLEQMLQHS